MLSEGRRLGNELLGPRSRLSATGDEIGGCAHVLLRQCHLTSGWERSRQGSLCSLGVSPAALL